MDLSSIQAEHKTFAGYGVWFQWGLFFYAMQPQLILVLFHQKIETHEGIQKHISGMHAENGD